ncbi:MAG: hypothetical protein ACI9SK_000291 [Zhongshania sp.]|jgi:hypothetical protein
MVIGTMQLFEAELSNDNETYNFALSIEGPIKAKGASYAVEGYS